MPLRAEILPRPALPICNAQRAAASWDTIARSVNDPNFIAVVAFAAIGLFLSFSIPMLWPSADQGAVAALMF
jgi:hypothetical protein